MVIVAAVCLSGCTPQDHVMTGLVDAQLVFVPCEEIAGVQHITATITSADGVAVEAWHSRGEDGRVGPGRPVTYGIDPPGFTTDVGPEHFDIASSSIDFLLRNTAVTDRIWHLEGSDLVEGKWLDENGNLHDEPCS